MRGVDGVRGCGIKGLGVSIPPVRLTNYDLEKMVETSDEWIVERTGIRERRLATPEVATSDLAAQASLMALEDAGVAPRDVDLVIVASASPDMLFPATACLVQAKIGASRAACFDIEIGCTGFVYGLVVGSQFVKTGLYDNVLVVGAETLSRIVNWEDRNTCVLFGDGAGAALLSPVEEGRGIIGTHLGADGSGADLLRLPAGGSRLPASHETVDAGLHYVHMDGKAVFKFAVKAMNSAVQAVLNQCGKTPRDVDLLIPHQANLRIIDSACQYLGIPRDKVVVNIDRYGNTSSASVPIALWEAVKDGRVNEGDFLVLVAFGAGLSWGSVAITW
ncbi:MAG: ketoacyl-ACP synthase III [Firmicutes bacterium]|nr:ketoacyl-ACP synthase III [Candidatus Fermentithermobacillaceae bacterium]